MSVFLSTHLTVMLFFKKETSCIVRSLLHFSHLSLIHSSLSFSYVFVEAGTDRRDEVELAGGNR